MERRRGVPGGWPCLLAALGALLAAGRAAAPRARFSPFFFLCTHHGELEGDGEQGEVLIALHIAGSPAAYVPGQEYHGRCRRPPCSALRGPCGRAAPGGPVPRSGSAAAQGRARGLLAPWTGKARLCAMCTGQPR
uniref:Reelin n=1 Tax=Strigops habroptila TaxID=2489341 RepID=A0A672UCK6_STRHB